MTEPDTHRDTDGKPVLVGPDCPDCGLFKVVHYQCNTCGHRWEVMGHYRWSWQGKNHWHEPLDQSVLRDFVVHIKRHVDTGRKDALIQPAEDK